ncbi:multiple epidermal growth factor-like domains protein 11 isoform X2 [Crassostrea angulata]|uniref:multiple epidermal growth factor-like domains protein 11 isoform X2 n=1 Tax=Magallana angulata TaxID=2784310 RepID=UPI0022B201C2|nr:multiple epidermal growth factor-like domains protein 11 isoform X2 [Crassostrea angulata]
MLLPTENIALNKPASQQHPYPDRPQWGADRAVDGLKSNLDILGEQCTISADKYLTSEWRVDLQEVLSIHHIFIQYRTGNVVWDKNNGYTSRFLGFSVYISNTTDKKDGTLCFKDTSYTRATIPNPTNITCFTHGRYVIYHNNRTQPEFPPGYSMNAYNELCEVEVYGCPELGYDGENCSSLCPEKCKDDQCYAGNKTCLSCVAGYIGSQCIEECDGGTFGARCINMCGKCAQNEHCHHINGSCMNGCDPGFYGHQCKKICETGKYGIDCQQRCSAFCHTSGICHHITGACKDGCKSGWKGTECLEVQDYGKTSTTLYVVIASLSVLVINNVVLVLYVILLCKHSKNQKKNKAYEQNKKENMFTQDTSGYDSVISRAEENYQELAIVTADR